MKNNPNKIITFLLMALFVMSSFFGCSVLSNPTENTDPPTQATKTDTTAETTHPATAEVTINYEAEYLAKIEDYENIYGSPQLNETFLMENGLYYANLVDFDKNGMDELVLGYIDLDNDSMAFVYEIWAVVDNTVILADTGDLLQTGGVDPSVYIAYTEDCAYFVAGSRQAYTRLDYRTFDGREFYSELSLYTNNYYDENRQMECTVNGNAVTTDEYRDTVKAFEDKFTETDNQFFYEVSDCLNRIADTKTNLGD